MAKIEKASDELKALFNKIRNTTTIPNWVEFEIMSNDKQKELYKILKLNDLVEKLTEGLNFVVIFNEEIFNELPDDMQTTAIDECLAGVWVSENEVITLEKPNFNTHSSVLQKYGHEPIIRLHESVKTLFDEKKQREDEEKAARGGKRGRKPKN